MQAAVQQPSIRQAQTKPPTLRQRQKQVCRRALHAPLCLPSLAMHSHQLLICYMCVQLEQALGGGGPTRKVDSHSRLHARVHLAKVGRLSHVFFCHKQNAIADLTCLSMLEHACTYCTISCAPLHGPAGQSPSRRAER